ncbi:MAG TPA: GNAT family protein [Ignavibacteria bacterium]|nr:GNAT family N-acetyltransferase [Bacteroidota bacterium]HRF65413.1 GNAT family protein [Ignavibacteria bacterium]HRJ04689.1 GNAT family protein [Ignavibacteria bacterium]HRJ84756.1 GNAT family protein [Ignavibacteria bacterium]
MDNGRIEKNKKIKVVPLAESDLERLIAWAEDERTMLEWCGPVFDFPLTIEQLQSYFAETKGNAPNRLIYKAVDESGNVAGMCELGAVSQKNESASLCRIFTDKNFRGKGIANHLISEVLYIAFEQLALTRVELNVYTFNLPAIKCYEKLGFKREGMRRKSTKYNNEYWDGYIYSLLKEEWKAG